MEHEGLPVPQLIDRLIALALETEGKAAWITARSAYSTAALAA